MKTKAIGVILLLGGVISALTGSAQLTRFAHLHTPSSYLVDTYLLDSVINGDEKLERKLREETERAQRHLSTIFETHTAASIGLVLSGGFQCLLGMLLVFSARNLRDSRAAPIGQASIKSTEQFVDDQYKKSGFLTEKLLPPLFRRVLSLHREHE